MVTFYINITRFANINYLNVNYQKLFVKSLCAPLGARGKWGSSVPQVPDGHQRLSIVGRFQRQFEVSNYYSLRSY